MAHLHRFFVPPDTPDHGKVTLPSAEAHHAPRVVRVRTGDAVALFDGEGRELSGEIVSATAQGAIPISLGAATYRSEAAAVLASALVLYELGELGALE